MRGIEETGVQSGDTTVLIGCSLYMRSATRNTSPRERNSPLASATFLPTRFGMLTSRPWIANRIAVSAERRLWLAQITVEIPAARNCSVGVA